MPLKSWYVYLMLVLIVTAVPGPAALFIMTKSILHGWRKASFSAMGNVVGLFCLGIFAVTGLGAVVKTSEVAFNVIKYAGAAYLIIMGLRLFFQKDMDVNVLQDKLISEQVSSHKIFFQAIGVAISNPKAIVFLTALFPQFLNIREPLFPQFAGLISLLMICSFSFLMAYALLAHRAKAWLMKPNRTRMVHRTSGSLFVSFGVLLAASKSK